LEIEGVGDVMEDAVIEGVIDFAIDAVVDGETLSDLDKEGVTVDVELREEGVVEYTTNC